MGKQRKLTTDAILIKEKEKNYTNRTANKPNGFETIPYYTTEEDVKARIRFRISSIPLELKNPDPIISDLDEIVIHEDEVTFSIDYPLENPFKKTYTHLGGFTRRDVLDIIYRSYESIYKEENDTIAIGAAKAIPKYSNRNITNGKYGIWGHFIHQLGLNEVLYKKESREVILIIDTDHFWVNNDDPCLVEDTD